MKATIWFGRLVRLIALWAALGSDSVPDSVASAPGPDFGFTGPEIYPIDSQISQLRVADLDGDSKNDLIVLIHDRILVYPQE